MCRQSLALLVAQGDEDASRSLGSHQGLHGAALCVEVHTGQHVKSDALTLQITHELEECQSVLRHCHCGILLVVAAHGDQGAHSRLHCSRLPGHVTLGLEKRNALLHLGQRIRCVALGEEDRSPQVHGLGQAQLVIRRLAERLCLRRAVQCFLVGALGDVRIGERIQRRCILGDRHGLRRQLDGLVRVTPLHQVRAGRRDERRCQELLVPHRAAGRHSLATQAHRLLGILALHLGLGHLQQHRGLALLVPLLLQEGHLLGGNSLGALFQALPGNVDVSERHLRSALTIHIAKFPEGCERLPDQHRRCADLLQDDARIGESRLRRGDHLLIAEFFEESQRLVCGGGSRRHGILRNACRRQGQLRGGLPVLVPLGGVHGRSSLFEGLVILPNAEQRHRHSQHRGPITALHRHRLDRAVLHHGGLGDNQRALASVALRRLLGRQDLHKDLGRDPAGIRAGTRGLLVLDALAILGGLGDDRTGAESTGLRRCQALTLPHGDVRNDLVDGDHVDPSLD
mmetsp:Transcript_23190/g.49404  ORF Transcript_23190/g.49404 Transcript_23190/m.49404 type:complete len:513 (-) Transcript_23190:47-1585(-)